jgi:hypothetical protein
MRKKYEKECNLLKYTHISLCQGKNTSLFQFIISWLGICHACEA